VNANFYRAPRHNETYLILLQIYLNGGQHLLLLPPPLVGEKKIFHLVIFLLTSLRTSPLGQEYV
jgi:hypothetical protein